MGMNDKKSIQNGLKSKRVPNKSANGKPAKTDIKPVDTAMSKADRMTLRAWQLTYEKRDEFIT